MKFSEFINPLFEKDRGVEKEISSCKSMYDFNPYYFFLQARVKKSHFVCFLLAFARPLLLIVSHDLKMYKTAIYRRVHMNSKVRTDTTDKQTTSILFQTNEATLSNSNSPSS